MQGREELGRLGEYELELLSTDRAVNLDAVLGKSVTVKLELANDKVRTFSGYVTRFSLAGMHGRYHRYQATLRPWLWFLTRTTNCRIFQGKKIPEVLKEIFEKHTSVADVKFELTESYTPLDYCVQYRESDFNFVSRLMEDEGIYYWFEDKDGKESLILTDTPASHESVAGCESLPYGAVMAAAPDIEYVSEWRVHHAIETRN